MKLQNLCKILGVLVLATSLAACGSSKGDRALSGGAIGAGVGALGSTIVGGSTLGGAAVGGLVGAGVGATTDKKDINLGD